MNVDSLQEPLDSSRNRNRLLRELVSGGLLAGGLFWIMLSALLLVSTQSGAASALLSRMAQTMGRALSGAEIHTGYLLLLLISGAMMLWQSRALIKGRPWVPALFASGIAGLGLQLFSAASGAIWTSGAFAILIGAGLVLAYLWVTAAPAQVDRTVNESRASAHTAYPHLDEKPVQQVDPILQHEPAVRRELGTLASVTSLNTHKHDDSVAIVVDGPETQLSGIVVADEPAAVWNLEDELASINESRPEQRNAANQFEEDLSLSVLADDEPTIIESSEGLMPPSVVSEQQEKSVEDTQEIAADVPQVLEALDEKPELLEPFNLDQAFELPDLESTREMDVPDANSIPFTNASDDGDDDLLLPELDKTMVMDRPVFLERSDTLK